MVLRSIHSLVFFRNIQLVLNPVLCSHFRVFLNIASGIFVINYTRSRMEITPVYNLISVPESQSVDKQC